VSDATVTDCGPVIVLHLNSPSALDWGRQWLNATSPVVTIVRRDADAVLEGMRDDGLALTGEYNA
jgi:hypothetical protein